MLKIGHFVSDLVGRAEVARVAAVEGRRPRRGGDSPDMEGALLLLLDVRQAACPGITLDQPERFIFI